MNGQKRIGSLSLTHSTVGIWTSHDHAWKHILKTIEAPQRYLKVVVLPIPLCAEPLVVAFVQFVGRDPSLGRSNHAKPERCQLRCDQPRKRPLEMYVPTTSPRLLIPNAWLGSAPGRKLIFPFSQMTAFPVVLPRRPTITPLSLIAYAMVSSSCPGSRSVIDPFCQRKACGANASEESGLRMRDHPTTRPRLLMLSASLWRPPSVPMSVATPSRHMTA